MGSQGCGPGSPALHCGFIVAYAMNAWYVRSSARLGGKPLGRSATPFIQQARGWPRTSRFAFSAARCGWMTDSVMLRGRSGEVMERSKAREQG